MESMSEAEKKRYSAKKNAMQGLCAGESRRERHINTKEDKFGLCMDRGIASVQS